MAPRAKNTPRRGAGQAEQRRPASPQAKGSPVAGDPSWQPEKVPPEVQWFHGFGEVEREAEIISAAVPELLADLRSGLVAEVDDEGATPPDVKAILSQRIHACLRHVEEISHSVAAILATTKAAYYFADIAAEGYFSTVAVDFGLRAAGWARLIELMTGVKPERDERGTLRGENPDLGMDLRVSPFSHMWMVRYFVDGQLDNWEAGFGASAFVAFFAADETAGLIESAAIIAQVLDGEAGHG